MGTGDVAEVERFELLDQLGVGANGVVHRVLDRTRAEEVALKTLKVRDARSLYRFKREFRTAAGLSHPNLIRLHELFCVDDEWMFTMERIDGVTFTRWVRPGDELDLPRLRDALRQLADGVAALHAAGLVHRDLKPSNVLVDHSGRVVILDFGLIVDLDLVDHTHDHAAVGTPAYMSPEQAADRPLTGASDWYAVGVMLFEALTGRRPFEGGGAQVLLAKQHGTPAPPGAVVPGLPVDLETLCLDLLSRAPGDRPGDDTVLRALGAAPSPWTLRIAAQAELNAHGFEPELALLHEALIDSHAHAVHVFIDGPPGSGKSALLRVFGDQARAAGAVVLGARANPREQVPMRGADTLADELSKYLMTLPADELARLIPADAAALTRLFPAMRRVPGFDGGGAPASKDDPAAVAAAFAVVRELLVRIAATRPVVVTFDDTHWASPSGPTLTTRFFTGDGAPRLLSLFTYDTEVGDSRVRREFESWTGDVRRIHRELQPAVSPPAD